jgi:hypothetical protein
LAKFTVMAVGEVIKGAVAFDQGEYYYSDNITSTVNDSSSITWSYWIKTQDLTSRSFTSTWRSVEGRRYIATHNANGSVRFYLQSISSTLDRTSVETGVIKLNQWHHVVASIDVANGIFLCYVDGVPLTFTAGTLPAPLLFSNPGRVTINSDHNTLGADSRANTLAQVYISPTFQDISNASIRQRFYNNGWVDMGTNGTLSGADTPVLFHIGNLSTTPPFTSNGGTWGFTYTSVGTPENSLGPQSSWNDWTTENVGTTLLQNPTVALRDFRVLDQFSNNEMFVIGALNSNRSNYKIYKYTISENTLSYNSETNIPRTSEDIVFNGCQIAVMPALNKALFFNGASYYVLTYSAGSVSMSARLTGNASFGNFGAVINPTNQLQCIRFGGTGILQLSTFNNSTNTATFGTSTTAISGSKSGSGFWTRDTNGTIKFAYLYFDTTTNFWKIRHYASDLSSFSDVTLNSASNPAGEMSRAHNVIQKLNQAVVVLDNDSTMPCFSVSYNGSAFTMSSIVNLTMPSSVYNNIRTIPGIRFIGEDTWAVSVHVDNNTTTRENWVGLIKAETNNPQLLGWQLTTNANANAGNVRGGLGLITTGDKLIAVSDGQGGAAEGQPSLTLLAKPQ